MTTVTTIEYMYRDADNYKAYVVVDLAGDFTDEQYHTVAATLSSVTGDQNGFIPAQIGWPHAGCDEGTWTSFPSDRDHPWHELDLENSRTTVAWSGPTPTQTVEEWVDLMVAAHAAGWDDITYGIEA